MISSPASSGSSLSTSSRCAWPPSNRVVNRLRKCWSTCSIGVEQAHPPFAVEAADRAAQAVDRLLQLVALGGAGQAAVFQLGQLLLGDEVDRSQPLALGGHAVETGFLRLGIVELAGVEAEPLGQQRRRAFELLAALPGELGAAGFLRLGAGNRPGPGLARPGERLAGFGKLAGDGRAFALGLLLGARRPRQPAPRSPGCPSPLGSISIRQALGLVGQIATLGGQLLGALGGFQQPRLGIPGARPPFPLLALRGGVALAVGGHLAGAGGGRGAHLGHRLPGGGRGLARLLDLAGQLRRVVQSLERRPSRSHRFARSREQWLQIGTPLGERRALRVQPFERGGGGIGGPRRFPALALGGRSRGPRRIGIAPKLLDRLRRLVARRTRTRRQPYPARASSARFPPGD